MKSVELYAQVRYAVQIEGISRREAARRYGIDPRTVAKMLTFSVPPGYRRSRPPARPKLDPFTAVIDQIMLEDEGRPKKQRHTAKRIFERLRDEHGYAGGITIVKDYVRAHRLRHREVFVPLRHDPGHAQVDFGEALAEIAGVEGKIHFFAMDLPHSDACFVRAYPAETTEAFCDGHNAACSTGRKVCRRVPNFHRADQSGEEIGNWGAWCGLSLSPRSTAGRICARLRLIMILQYPASLRSGFAPSLRAH
jgi:transposase